MAEYPVLPPGLAAAGATQASPYRNVIIGGVGVAIMLFSAWALLSVWRAATGAGGAGSEHRGLMVSAGAGVLLGGVILLLAVASSREAARIRRLMEGELLPGEVMEFGGEAMLPDDPPSGGTDLLADWRVSRRLRAILLVTDQRLVVLPSRGLATTVYSWPRRRLSEVTSRVEGHRAVLSVDVEDEGRVELWVRGPYDLGRAQAALVGEGEEEDEE